MKTIFLDIDGVLNNRDYLSSVRKKATYKNPIDELEPRCIGLLNRIIRETRAVVVITSTWLWAFGFEKVRGFLSQAGIDKDVPLLRIKDLGRSSRYYKEMGIIHRLSHGVDAFVILDDDELKYPDHVAEHFIRTSFEEGLTEEAAEKAIEILGREDQNETI